MSTKVMKTANVYRATSPASPVNEISLVRAISAKGVERSGLSAMSLKSPMSDLSHMSPSSPSIKGINKCNNDITTRKNSNSFIFFGCWNNVNCKKEFLYRDIVLDYIHKNEVAVKQLYIAGDNWYTNIKKIDGVNYKVYLADILKRGYDKLYSMKKEIYIAVGNHDEDKDAKITDPKLQNNCNINTQKYYLKEIKDLKEGHTGRKPRIRRTIDTIREPTLEVLSFLEKKEKLTDNYLCNKGVYIYVDDIGVRYNRGNIVIIINTNKFDDYAEGLVYLESIKSFIKHVVDTRNNNGSGGSGEQIFVMGHIPLFNFKKDEIKIQDIDKKKPEFRNIIVGLFDILVDNNIIYICADTHNFSIMRIKCNSDDKRVLIQITAGSGGADPDLLKTEYPTSLTMPTEIIDKNTGYNFKIVAYALNSYGYATVSTDTATGSVSVCYKQVIKDSDDVSAATAASPVSAATKITEITYHIDMDNKNMRSINANSQLSPATSINIYKNTEICEKIKKQKHGYITSLNHKIACYKKDKTK